MDDLMEFLRARLDQDEREARRVPPNQSPAELRAMVTRESGEPFLVVASERVLREIDAKRRMIGRISSHAAVMGWDEVHGDLLRLLALPYADHPDYREGWRP
ncbi:DUF6221 family protein [Streptomyces malaysiensis]|uniref:DUF6221 family protein n=1 Tax=Streptomyces malaysiensis TaxID=92644 RepID=UPI003681F70F